LANPKSWGFLGANSHSRPDVEYKTMMEWINLEMHNPKLIAVTHYMVKHSCVKHNHHTPNKTKYHGKGWQSRSPTLTIVSLHRLQIIEVFDLE
jgi:hypothetical protein